MQGALFQNEIYDIMECIKAAVILLYKPEFTNPIASQFCFLSRRIYVNIVKMIEVKREVLRDG